MDASGDLGGRRGDDFAIEIKPILLPLRCPTFLKSVCLLAATRRILVRPCLKRGLPEVESALAGELTEISAKFYGIIPS
jgi:hypothetical protein